MLLRWSHCWGVPSTAPAGGGLLRAQTPPSGWAGDAERRAGAGVAASRPHSGPRLQRTGTSALSSVTITNIPLRKSFQTPSPTFDKVWDCRGRSIPLLYCEFAWYVLIFYTITRESKHWNLLNIVWAAFRAVSEKCYVFLKHRKPFQRFADWISPLTPGTFNIEKPLMVQLTEKLCSTFVWIFRFALMEFSEWKDYKILQKSSASFTSS